jgi:peptide/nickel transport system permease protein
MKPLAALIRRSPQAFAGGLILLMVLFIALAAPWVSPSDPDRVDPEARLLPPMSRALAAPPAGLAAGKPILHILGTDAVGRDMLSRAIYGSRISLAVGVLAALLSALFGVVVGCVAGYFGGWIDAVASWLVDVQLSFPFLLLAIFLLGALGGGVAAVIVILALGTWVNTARIVRGQVLSVKAQGYVEAALTTGAGPGRVLVWHVLPNVLSPVVVLASFSMAQAILTEAGLSFLGVGLDPSTPSWGSMLNDGRDYLVTAWWMGAAPGAAIAVTVMGATLLGEGLRDLLDPRRAR